jgi:hypothetical protein
MAPKGKGGDLVMMQIICDICKDQSKVAKRNRYPVELLNGSNSSRVVYKHKIIDLCDECEINALTNLVLQTYSQLDSGLKMVESLEYLKTINTTGNKLGNMIDIPWRGGDK